jgi:phosphonate transport system substrate-binding protein
MNKVKGNQIVLLIACGLLVLLLASCRPAAPEQIESVVEEAAPVVREPLVVGGIPDQDPEKLQRLFDRLTDYLSDELGVPVVYRPVTSYSAAVTAFRVGDLDLVWFGGLTGVQARVQVPGALALAQRDIDNQSTSVFIANTASNLRPVDNANDLAEQLRGRTFTFASESSTAGRLMPQFFLSQVGFQLADFRGETGFAGAHDAVIALVEAGSYEVGVLHEPIWANRVAAGEVDLEKVQAIWETPTFHDWHWVIHPDVSNRYGDDFAQKAKDAFLKLDPGIAEHAEILDLFGTSGRFIEARNEAYAGIEAVGREIGLIVE